ncbi:GRIP1-associated protein 1 [Hyalella azteca]|uniref:GRIP1-associated protein 1 n=1 Tax=Hyalella azteca TaxID=294128 RepID=A0A8B7PAB9_HYAAZ|nr:GRIP1-associated protein 1 [Hyalella azteca]XP_047738544.1 GRIP1-associated protein 1 [Hyalella azteca]
MTQFNAEDFSIFQTQLLELREKNYALEDRLKKQNKECASLSEQCSRQAIAIRASKKATEADALTRDNNVLRTRLRDQEEEFKLQNSTLLQELARLATENERLEQQLTDLCRDHSSDTPSDATTDDSKQVLMLRTELSLLQKRLERQAEEHIKQLEEAKERLNSSVERNAQLQQLLSTHAILQEEGAIRLGGGGVSFKKLSLEEDHSLGPADEAVPPLPAADHNLKAAEARLQECEARLRDATSRADELAAQVSEAQSASQRASAALDESHLRLQAEQQLTLDLQKQLEDKQNSEAELREQLNLATELKDTAERQLLQSDASKHQLQSEVESLKTDLGSEQSVVAALGTELQEARRQLQEAQHKIKEQQAQHRELLDQYKAQCSELKKELEALKEDAARLERERSMAQERAAQFEDEIASLKEFWHVEKEKIQAENLVLARHLEEQAANQKQAFTTELEISSIQRQELEDKIADLQKQVNDAREDRVIHERRGASLLKDLKKQLSAERRRADKLQDKLAQVLADPSLIAGFSSSVSDAGDDVSSVSSWSMVSGDQRPTDATQSPSHSSNKSECSSDTSELLARLAALQNANWQKEEQIQHLEASAAAMAQDLLTKSNIIQHYCARASPSPRATRLGPGAGETPTGVRKVLSRLREVGEGVAGNVAEMATGSKEEANKEMNRRLQALLEETLLKNINLHRDVDMLTQQVQQLTALATAGAQPASCTTVGGGTSVATTLHSGAISGLDNYCDKDNNCDVIGNNNGEIVMVENRQSE